ncbi:MAG TPA: hypothetical protein VNL91_04255 [Thermoanaerobaculia bacterium]|nr:hypothetical protein [Thermoanaerobaculia bacterium]
MTPDGRRLAVIALQPSGSDAATLIANWDGVLKQERSTLPRVDRQPRDFDRPGPTSARWLRPNAAENEKAALRGGSVRRFLWWSRTGSNRRPPECHLSDQ